MIVYARTRNKCIDRVKRALSEFVITGVKHNIPMHQIIMNNEHFVAGNYDTSFIPRYKILEQVTEHVKNMPQDDMDNKVAAIGAAVGAFTHAAAKK